MRTEKIEERIQKELLSDNSTRVLAAVELLKSRGNSLYIPVLFDVLLNGDDPEVLVATIDLLATIKDKTAVNAFVRGIETKKYAPIHKIILSCCWQNGLDFSNFLPVFIDIILKADWETAFEAFTVIDNLEYLPLPEIAEASLIKIRKALPGANDQIQYFLKEIVKKLEE